MRWELTLWQTVEPGCYFHPHLVAPVRDSKHIDLDVLKRYEGMGGVRIEDVVLVRPLLTLPLSQALKECGN